MRSWIKSCIYRCTVKQDIINILPTPWWSRETGERDNEATYRNKATVSSWWTYMQRIFLICVSINHRRLEALPTVLSRYEGVSTHLRHPFRQHNFWILLTLVTLLLIDALIGFNAGLTAALVGWTAAVLETCNGGRLLSCRLRSETIAFLNWPARWSTKTPTSIILESLIQQLLEKFRELLCTSPDVLKSCFYETRYTLSKHSNSSKMQFL